MKIVKKGHVSFRLRPSNELKGKFCLLKFHQEFK